MKIAIARTKYVGLLNGLSVAQYNEVIAKEIVYTRDFFGKDS